MGYEALVALRYLRARRKQVFLSVISILSVAGVALGVCALIVVLSVMGGFENEVKSKLLGQNAHVSIFEAAGGLRNPARVVDLAVKDPQVAAASPFVYGQVMIVSDYGAGGGILRGIEIPGTLKVLDLAPTMIMGDLEDLDTPGDLPGIVLGSVLASRLGAGPGKVVNVINPIGEDTPVGRIPKSEPFRVVGISKSDLYQYDSTLCYMSLKTAQDFQGLGKRVSGVEIKVKDIYQADQVAKRLIKKLGPAYYARDWKSTNLSLFAALKLERFTLFLILNLIIVVAAFEIVGSLIMLVKEKTRDIAILKAMGATESGIRKIFTLEGLVLGVSGTFLGLLGGLFLCWLLARYQFIKLPPDVYPMTTLPVQVDPLSVGVVCVCAVLISLLATLYPAHTASRLDPVEAIRYQ